MVLLFCRPGNVFANGKADVAQDSITVYIFLSENCPICQTLTLELKRVYDDYHGKGITFIGLFPNEKQSTDASVRKYGRKNSLPFSLSMDGNHEMVKRFSATVTPQVFVVRNADNHVLYKGKTDNHFEAIGKRREVVTEHYLQNALESIIHNRPISPAETPPAGCYITL